MKFWAGVFYLKVLLVIKSLFCNPFKRREDGQEGKQRKEEGVCGAGGVVLEGVGLKTASPQLIWSFSPRSSSSRTAAHVT